MPIDRANHVRNFLLVVACVCWGLSFPILGYLAMSYLDPIGDQQFHPVWGVLVLVACMLDVSGWLMVVVNYDFGPRQSNRCP